MISISDNWISSAILEIKCFDLLDAPAGKKKSQQFWLEVIQPKCVAASTVNHFSHHVAVVRG